MGKGRAARPRSGARGSWSSFPEFPLCLSPLLQEGSWEQAPKFLLLWKHMASLCPTPEPPSPEPLSPEPSDPEHLIGFRYTVSLQDSALNRPGWSLFPRNGDPRLRLALIRGCSQSAEGREEPSKGPSEPQSPRGRQGRGGLSPRVTATEAPGLKSSVPKLKGALALATRENPRAAMKTQRRQKEKKSFLKKK